MTLLFILFAVALAGGTFYIGMEIGSIRERMVWEDRLALPPPSKEKPPGLPKHAGESGPY